jgi:hypothetical protein
LNLKQSKNICQMWHLFQKNKNIIEICLSRNKKVVISGIY